MSRSADTAGVRAFRGTLLWCRRDPGDALDTDAVVQVPDGLLVVRDGLVERSGPADPLLDALPAGTPVTDYSGRIIVPGFVDVHVHYVQTEVIASYGSQLLEWLERYTFPEERRFEDPGHARAVAGFFLDELLRNGTTSALVLGSVHASSADALFEAAERRRLRVAAGKVLMDRNCPEWLRDTPESGAEDSARLIERWHGRGRLHYALTPRFAPTSSDAQLARAGELLASHPDVYLHTHVAENRDEVAWVAQLFPWSRSYLDVYDRYGLLRERAVLAHCLHLDDADRARMAQTGAAMAFCPTSNLFLGSGLFDLARAREAGVRVGLGTDVGAGTSLSMLRTLAEAYKVCQLAGHSLSPWRALWLATLGGAEALRLDDRIGSLEPGREADFTVLDPAATPILARRTARSGDLAGTLFALLAMGDDRCVTATHVLGMRADTLTAQRRDDGRPARATGSRGT